MKLSVLIVSYNSKKYIDKAISSIKSFSASYEVEIIVVDNNSNDDTVEFLNEKYPDITIVKNSYNYGFSRAMNQGFRLAKGEYVMSFNPDGEFTKTTAENIINFLDENPRVGKVGVVVEDSNGDISYPVVNFRKWASLQTLKTLKSKLVKKKISFQEDEVKYVDWIFGTGIVVRQSIFTDGWLYPENSFLFWEEYWLSKYVKSRGYMMAILPTAKIIHHTSVTFKFDNKKLLYARSLSLAVGWRVKSEAHGKFVTIISFLLSALDNLILSCYLSFKSWIYLSSPEQELQLADYKARLKAVCYLLLKGRKGASELERKATLFFNNGVFKEHPLEFKTYKATKQGIM